MERKEDKVEETMEEKDMELNKENKEAEEKAVETEETKAAEETKTSAKEKTSKKKRSVRELEIALDKSEENVKDLKDKYQRLMAEFENRQKECFVVSLSNPGVSKLRPAGQLRPAARFLLARGRF